MFPGGLFSFRRMDFPENVKEEARQRAHYACVWCFRQEFFVEVHHIVEQKDGGPSTIENAAPLCPQCHTHIGPNPDLRRQLRERRDWWWGECARRATPVFSVNLERTNTLYELLTAMEAQGERTEGTLNELKAIILGAEEQRRLGVSSARTVQEVVQATSAAAVTLTPGTAKLNLTGFAPTIAISTGKKPKR